EPGDVGLGPALAQQSRAVTGAAAEIDDAARRRQIDARQQVECRPRALCAEAKILSGIAMMHCCSFNMMRRPRNYCRIPTETRTQPPPLVGISTSRYPFFVSTTGKARSVAIV